MVKIISLKENNINLNFEITEKGDVRLLHFSPNELSSLSIKQEKDKKWFRIIELQVTGENQNDHHASKYTGTSPADRLQYKTHRDYRNNQGRKLEIVLTDKNLSVTVNYQFYDKIPIVRAWSQVTNISTKTHGIEYISSFALTGIAKEGLRKWEQKSEVWIPHNTWKRELQWRKYSVDELGLNGAEHFSMKRISINSTGTLSTSEYLPIGCFQNTESDELLFWQIENNGSWNWEISSIANYLYLQLSGPTETENHWWKQLKPGETFTTIPVAVGTVVGDIEKAMQVLTQYRRKIKRNCKDNKKLPVIFNDYMNCLMGDPTTEKLLPLIDAAAETGCEYFCIDAGWYSEGSWWDGVGEWLPSKERFPNGIQEPVNYIQKKGMIPGLWLEIESMGINCSLVDKVPEDWFFQRHDQVIIDHSRLQLDFRNPEVREYANKVIERLVDDYGIGYIKMDYNVEYGSGTELNADSFGDGLLQHNRAYLNWLDSIFERYSDLIIENCGSGGCRMDYALLSRHSIQSTSDNQDYRRYAAIAAASPTAVTPEQSACWSYPQKEGDNEEVIFNMVNSILLRIHQSGHLAQITKERKQYVKEGIKYYKSIRKDIPKSLPFWPLGLPKFSDKWVSLGLRKGSKSYLAVWRLETGDDICLLSLNKYINKNLKIKCSYPKDKKCDYNWQKKTGKLSVRLPTQNCARIFEIDVI